ncbi:histidine kinase dimerization/phosphoacceptor domain -containing protein [Flavobacterium artemisiae]|uniref:histidine kinase n=1 Tax=Flavobacterium artemisiae TaxID=2126556 RepID=A0ABW4HB88_9FLAO
MSNNFVNAFKNHLCSTHMVIFLFILHTQVFAQFKKDPAAINRKIAVSENDTQKVELLLTLGKCYLNKDGEFKNDLDNAVLANKQAKVLSDQLNYKLGIGKSILLSAQITREKGRPENGLKIARQALIYTQNNLLLELQAYVYLELSMYGSFEDKIKNKETALRIFKKVGAKEKQADILKQLGELYIIQENQAKGIALLKESLQLYQSIKFPHVQGVYNLLSEGYTQTGNCVESLKYALLAEKTAVKVRDSSLQMSSIYNHVGMAYYSLRQKNTSEEYFYKALEIAKKYKDTEYVRAINENLCTVLISQKKEKDALKVIRDMQLNFPTANIGRQMKENYLLLTVYRKLQNIDKAKIYYNKLVAYYGINAEKEKENRLQILRSYSNYHYQLKNYNDLYRIIRLIDSITTATNNNLMCSENHLTWFQADSSRGDYKNAIKHYQLYKSLSDSVYKGEKSKQINSLQIKFESEKKDKNIDLLTQQDKLQKIQIRNDSIIRYVFIASLIVLTLFILLLYNRFLLKKKTNKQLEIKTQEINEQNELNKKMLIEKEWLLKEIHHRVKNNLQIVISLLNTQSAYLDNEDALLAIQNSQHRMHAMSLIHQKLYQSDNLANIDMSWYIYELISYMKECFDTHEKINFVLNTEKVYLDVAHAVPLGLIINEAVNNAIKYAFPQDTKGDVYIELKNTGENNYKLIIADNGIGVAENFNAAERKSLGVNLMMGLSEQIDGNFEMKNDHGLKIKITFTRNTEFEGTADNSEII